MSHRSESRIFGKRSEKHVIIVAKGDQVRHMTVQPWMAAGAVGLACAFSIAYLAATSYLVLRDDLIGGTMARQARMQHDYEDRIAALRAQVDRVTSRQLLDQQVVEEKVEKLLRQQSALSSRNGKLGSLLERAEDSGLSTGAIAPPDAGATEDRRADAAAGIGAIERLMGLASGDQAPRVAALAYAAPGEPQKGESISERADRLFSRITLSLKGIERQQLDQIRTLTANAEETSDKIESIVRRTGVDMDEALDSAALIPAADPQADIGGPFVAPESSDIFDGSLVALDTALERLERTRDATRKLPFANPAPASDITSRFGNRVDPFLGRLALHAGIDFRAAPGTGVAATGAGTVTVAGRNGGYGNMVEIDHGNGISTRFAHLSAILVNVGDTVAEGETIGKSGNTGRSTGPHLHYEVRINGEAVDPMRFLNAGLKLSHFMN
ncbi:M23 family metallopeptidase [Ensifer soli]|uniref:M23 family metallopeptidase n=1 Tax=Ciceribacter sp. sgz301302 TaxID=3342379 RepID=UPI0035B849CE